MTGPPPTPDFPGNSYRQRQERQQQPPERPKAEKIISGEAVERKKPLGRKIADSFRGDDTQTVGGFILFEVLIPQAKGMILDIVSQGFERLMYGSAAPRRIPGRTNYTSYSSRPGGPGTTTSSAFPSPRRDISYRARASHDFREIVVATRGEAEDVLERLNDMIDEYKLATVADLYDMVGITGSFADEKWGWTDLRGASIRLVREGYLIDLPRTMAIDN